MSIKVSKCDRECPLSYDGIWCAGGGMVYQDVDKEEWAGEYPKECPLLKGPVTIERVVK